MLHGGSGGKGGGEKRGGGRTGNSRRTTEVDKNEARERGEGEGEGKGKEDEGPSKSQMLQGSPPIGQNVSEVFRSWKCMHLDGKCVLFREVVSLVQGCSGLHRGSIYRLRVRGRRAGTYYCTITSRFNLARGSQM